MVDTTWTNGGGDGLASNPANWSAGIDEGYNLLFNATSTANCSLDYAGALGTITIAAGYTGVVTQVHDMHITGFTMGAGTFTPVNTQWVFCHGPFVQTAGTITGDKLQLEITDGDLTLVSGIFQRVFHLKTVGVVNATTTNPANALCVQSLSNYGNLYTTRDINLNWVTSTGHVYVNNGTITAKDIIFQMRASSFSIYFGELNANLKLLLEAGANGNKTLTALNDLSVKALNVSSGHASYTLALDMNGRRLVCPAIVIDTRGVLINSSSTRSIIIGQSFDSSAGTFTEANTQVILNGNGTLKTGAHKFDELVQRDGVTTTLGSDITVTNEFDTAGSFIQGAYSITHENPEKRLIAPMINPIVRNPKRSPFFNNRFTKNSEIEVI